MICLFYRAFECFFSPWFIPYLCQVLLTWPQSKKGDRKDLGEVTTAFKFCGHWRIILLLSLRVNSTWGHKLDFILSLIAESKTPFPLTHLPLVRVCRGSNTHRPTCWPTSNKNSSNSQGVGNCWVVTQKWVAGLSVVSREKLWLVKILKCS